MILKLEIFGAKFNAYFCKNQQGSPQKRLLGLEVVLMALKNFHTQKVMVRQP